MISSAYNHLFVLNSQPVQFRISFYHIIKTVLIFRSNDVKQRPRTTLTPPERLPDISGKNT